MRAFLVANPRAGRVRGAEGVVHVVQTLKRVGFDVELIAESDPAAVPEALRAALVGQDPRASRVVVAGGDGTIRLALPAVIGTDFALALLPVGSVNVLARELGLPLTLEEAARVAAGARVRRIDLGVGNGAPFAINLGVGFDAAVVHAVRPGLKRTIGSAAYVVQGLAVLAAHRPRSLRVTVDDALVVERNAWLAVITNITRYTYRFRLCPEAVIDDGWLHLCLFAADTLTGRARQVVAVLRQRHVGAEGVEHYRGRRFRFECDPPLPVQMDGDAAGTTPLEVEVAAQAMSVVVPE